MDWQRYRGLFDPKAFHSNAEPEVKWIVEHLRDGDRALDVGCLDSGLLSMLLRMLPEAVGIDIRREAEMSSWTRRMDIRTPEFEDGRRFSAVIFLSTIEHIGLDVYGNRAMDTLGDVAALASAGTLLEPRGRVILTMPYDEHAVGRSRAGRLWERRYNWQAAEWLAESAGFAATAFLKDVDNELVCMVLMRKEEL